MFERQWFDPWSQVGLSNEALAHENLLKQRRFDDSLDIATRQLILAQARATPQAEFWKRQVHRNLSMSRNPNKAYRSRTISIAFAGFWNTFDIHNNEILNFIRDVCSEHDCQVTISTVNPDIVVSSCFGNVPKYLQKCTQILYLGENVRPQYRQYDFSISHDIDPYCDRNIYLPLWLLRSTRYGITQSDYEPYSESSLFSRETNWHERSGAVYLGNNMTPARAALLHYLENLGINVDWYGSHTRPVKSKKELYKSYLFSVCFENSISPGYITEKLIDGYVYGTIPIYMGSSIGGLLNFKSFINIDASMPILSQLKYQLESVDDFKQSKPLINRKYYYQILLNAKTNLWDHVIAPHLSC